MVLADAATQTGAGREEEERGRRLRELGRQHNWLHFSTKAAPQRRSSPRSDEARGIEINTCSA